MICDQCDFKTKCHEILVAHVAKNHKQCLKCGQTFRLLDDLLTHLQFLHGETVKCSKCEFKGYPSFELVYHQMVEHGACVRCNEEPNDDHHLGIQHKSRYVNMVIKKITFFKTFQYLPMLMYPVNFSSACDFAKIYPISIDLSAP